jgi:secreted trypsin-like serine protease
MKNFATTQFQMLMVVGLATALSFQVGCRQRPLTPNRKFATQGSAPYEEAVQRFQKKQGPKPLIVGGEPARPTAFPWQVSLAVSGMADPYMDHFCGGSVYSPTWIVTAGHCVVRTDPKRIVVTAGTNYLGIGTGSLRKTVKRIIVHKEFVEHADGSNDNDIALLELDEALPIGTTIQPIELLTPDIESRILIQGALLTVTGWGATQRGGLPVRELRFVNLPLVLRSSCNDPRSYDGRVTENMICAGLEIGGKDACQGDSGGPIMVKDTTLKLAGLVSWGDGCGRPYKFGVYTRVANYLDWIRLCTTNSKSCNQ